MSFNPMFMRVSVGPKASESTESTGTIFPAPHARPRELKPSLRIWS
jgi:hypothetical protein